MNNIEEFKKQKKIIQDIIKAKETKETFSSILSVSFIFFLICSITFIVTSIFSYSVSDSSSLLSFLYHFIFSNESVYFLVALGFFILLLLVKLTSGLYLKYIKESRSFAIQSFLNKENIKNLNKFVLGHLTSKQFQDFSDICFELQSNIQNNDYIFQKTTLLNQFFNILIEVENNKVLKEEEIVKQNDKLIYFHSLQSHNADISYKADEIKFFEKT